jgi:UDP-glucose 4-epimerase
MKSKNRKILVTGGAGYGGSHTVVALAQAGYKVVIADNFSNSDKRILKGLKLLVKKPVAIYHGDCTNERFLDSIFKKEGPIHAVIHFAAHKSVAESITQPFLYYSNNLGSLVSVINNAIKHKTSHVVFSSSCTVYGKPKRIPVHEKTSFGNSPSPYGKSKQMCEQILKATVRCEKDFKAVALRYFNIVGAHPSGAIGENGIRDKNFVPLMMESALGIRGKLVVAGNDYPTLDGTCIRDYTHVMDVADAHVLALDYLDKQKSESFYDAINLGTGQGHSVLEMIHLFEKVSNVKVPYSIGPRRTGDISAIYAKVDKAKNVLGWKSSRSVEEALRHAWKWQKNLQRN